MVKTIHSLKYKRVVEKLRQARRESGFTQAEVAKLLKKSQSYISKSEKGEQRLDILEFESFANLYKKPLSYFLN